MRRRRAPTSWWLLVGDVADVLLSRFFAVWEQDTTFLALLRAAMTSASAADALRHVFATQVAPALAAITPDHPAQRANLMGAFVIGLATTRYVLANPAVANLSHDELIRFARPVEKEAVEEAAEEAPADEAPTADTDTSAPADNDAPAAA